MRNRAKRHLEFLLYPALIGLIALAASIAIVGCDMPIPGASDADGGSALSTPAADITGSASGTADSATDATRNAGREAGDVVYFGGRTYIRMEPIPGDDQNGPVRALMGESIGAVACLGVPNDASLIGASKLPIGTPVFSSRASSTILIAELGDDVISYCTVE